MTDNFELLDIGQIEILHQQTHDRLETGDNCDDIRLQHDSLAAEIVKRGLPHDTAIICPEVVTDAPNYRRGFTDDVCTQCAFGQLFPLCNLYDFDYTKGYTCDSFRYFEVLELIPPHGYLMLSEKKKAIASVEKLNTDKAQLIVSKGEAFGIAELEEPAQIKTKDFDSEEWQKQHRITQRERRQWWADKDTFYIYRLKKWHSFGKSRIYEDNTVKKSIKLSTEQWQQIEKAKELPKQIVLIENAVGITNDDTFVISPDVGYSQELRDTLKATYECDVAFNTSDDTEKQYEIPIYSLALIRNHKARPIVPKKKKQGENMPFRIRKRGEEYCVIKINPDDSDGESQGCHETEAEAEAQLTALNINVTAEEERAIHKPKKKPKKDKQFSVDEYPGKLRRQFTNKFNLDGRDIQPLEIFSIDDTPNMAGFIIANKDGNLFKIDYMTNELGTTFADETMWIEVVPDFRPKGYTQIAEYKKETAEIEVENKPGFIDKLRNVAKSIGEFITFAEEKETPLFMTDVGVMQKKVNGELWHFTWSTNAFEDREGELFSTKALEQYVAENENREDKGYFNLWHINAEDGNFNTDFAIKQWQGVVGRFLVEAGPYLDTVKGQSAKEFFKQYSEGHPELAPEGWGCSPEFRYLPEERAAGIYENIWITRTSTLPKMAAANIWTDTRQLARHKMALSESQMKAAITAFGEDEVKRMLAEGEQKTTELETANIAHKEVAEEKPKEIEINVETLAAEISKQFQLDLNPLIEGQEATNKGLQDLAQRVKALEEKQDIVDLTETPRFVLGLRASQSEKTIVTEDDGLKDKKPVSAKNDKGNAFVSPEAFFNAGN